ncbi:hypothetical protein ACOMHN_026933 [Nucella lapillus]
MSEIESSDCVELLSATIKVREGKKMTIAAYYRPPNRTDQKYMDDTKAEMNKLKRKTGRKTGRNILTVAGDFNSPDIDWQTLTTTNKRYPSRVNQTYLDIVADNDLEQMVDFPTRKDKTTLDIILTSHPSFKVRCKPLPSVGNSDHDIVLYDTALAPHQSRLPRRKIFLWKKADVEGMRQDVKEFANTYQYPDPSTPNALEQMWSDIKQMLSETVEKRVPSKTSAARHTNPWITTSIRRAIHRKQRAHKKARMTGKKKDVNRKMDPLTELFFCVCGVVQKPVDKITFFTLLGVEESFDVDVKKLSQVYKDLQKHLHPDKFSQKSETEQSLAEQQSTLLNKAYFTLLKPLSRALYLLELHGRVIQEGTTSTEPEFLMEVLDLNERIGESSSEDMPKIEADIASKIQQNMELMARSFAENDYDTAQAFAVSLKYYVNVESKVKSFYRSKM